MKRTGIAVIAALTIALTGCGGTESESGGPSVGAETEAETPRNDLAEAAEQGASETPMATADPVSALEAVAAQIPDVGSVVEMTEDNDVNGLIGRPNQYSAGAFAPHAAIDCDQTALDELSTDCGLKIEQFESADRAQARADEIQEKLEAFGLGAEWNYVRGDGLLLRVAAAIKPSDAQVIESAFLG